MALESLAVRREKKAALKRKRIQTKSASEKQYAAEKIAYVRKNHIGYTLEWEDSNPLMDANDDESGLFVSSSNRDRAMRAVAKDQWADMRFRNWIITSYFRWRAEITVVYSLPRNKTNAEKRDRYELTAHVPLRDPVTGEETEFNELISSMILESRLSNTFYRDGSKNKGIFLRAEYKIICVGV